MQLQDLLSKTCVIGLSYFDQAGELLKQTQYAGRVIEVNDTTGISIKLQHADATTEQANFILPPNLTAWFKAPAGHYRHAATGVDIENPDFLTTWCVYRTQENTADGQHEWWDWVPNTEPPSVG
jgi:hypothetical protein